VKIKKAVALSTVLGVALAGIAFAAPSNADPVSGGYTITGSDTLQDAVNAIVNGTSITGAQNFRLSAGGNFVGNYDATGTTVIQLKGGAGFVGRPSGSGDGKKSLSRSIDGGNWVKNGITATITGQVDLARSSSGAGTGATGGINEPSGPLTFVPFGRDAVAYAFKFGSGATLANTPGIDQLTTAQLTQIFGSATPVVLGSTTVVPVLPQSTSGTRQFFLGAISVTSPDGVPNQSTTTLIENDATVLAPAANTVQIIPFSVASWVAQANKATAINTTGTVNGVAGAVNLGAVNGLVPFTVSGTSLVPSKPAYDSTVFGRDVYIIASTVQLAADPALAAFVDPTDPSSLTYFGVSNSPATAKAVKLKFGFLAPSSSTPFHTNLF